MELTRVHNRFDSANVFFPDFSTNDWQLVHSVNHPKDDRHAYSFTYESWRRKNPISGI